MADKTLNTYTETDLLDKDPSQLLIPVDNYALHTLPKAFKNFDEVIIPLIRRTGTKPVFDLTAFYSRRRGISEEEHEMLIMHNQHAFSAAKKVDGLVMYFQGHLLTLDKGMEADSSLGLDFVPDCLSFCIWESLEHAKEGSRLPEHRKAASQVNLWYDGFVIKKYQLTLHEVIRNDKKHEEVFLVVKPKIN